MTINRSLTPFFRNRETIDRVTEIAGLDPLVIYAGAGVTIDRVGLGWRPLIDALLKIHDEDDKEISEKASALVRQHIS